jgi:YihY family inner membrane protein
MQLPRQLEFPKRVVQATLDDEVPDLAAGLAYRFLFAIFPFAIFLAALAGSVAQLAGLQDPSGQIVGSLSDNLPPDIAAQVRPQLDAVLGSTKPGLLSIGAVLALWAAMGGIGAVMKAMNRAYDVEETRGFVPRTFRSAVLTVLGAIGILVAFVTIVGGSLLTQQAVQTLGVPQSAWDTASLIRYPLVIVLVAVAVAILYRYGPNVAVSIRYTLIGGFAFAVLWLLATVAFGFYVANFANYSNTYGALGGAVVLMLWLYLTALLMLVGAELVAELAKEREPHKIAARKREITAANEALRKVGEKAGEVVGTVAAAAGDDGPDPGAGSTPPVRRPRRAPEPEPDRPQPVTSPRPAMLANRPHASRVSGAHYVASSATTRAIAVAVVAVGAVTGAIAALLSGGGEGGAST